MKIFRNNYLLFLLFSFFDIIYFVVEVILLNILLVEDNLSIALGLDYAFKKEGYNIVHVSSKNECISYLENNNYDIVILDVNLPDGNGFDLYESYILERKIPTLFLTACDDENDVIKGLNLGAEDYMVKPFSTKELLIRVKKILLRSVNKSIVSVSNIKFDLNKMEVYDNNQKVSLSSLELQILYLLFSNINKVVTRNVILDTIWDITGNDVDDHTVTVYLKRIRSKLSCDIITTIKGIGYRIDEK